MCTQAVQAIKTIIEKQQQSTMTVYREEVLHQRVPPQHQEDREENSGFQEGKSRPEPGDYKRRDDFINFSCSLVLPQLPQHSTSGGAPQTDVLEHLPRFHRVNFLNN